MSRSVNALAVASENTRNELLESGLRLLRQLPASATLGHLTANKIATEAGRTSGAFFHQWPTIEEYLKDFVAFVLRPELAVNLQATQRELLEGVARGQSFARAMVAAGRGVPRQTAQDPQTIIELLLWNRSIHDDDFRKTVARHYDTLDAGAGDAFRGLMTLLGREPRPPFTAEVVAAVCTSVAQGLALRAATTPDLYPDELYGWMIMTLVPLLTREPEDRRDATGFVDDLPVHVPTPDP
jgi:AcrR family transcriptional regulator